MLVKPSTLTLRIDKELKDEASKVLDSLGLTLSTAVDMYLKQIVLTKSIPFEISNKESLIIKKQGMD